MQVGERDQKHPIFYLTIERADRFDLHKNCVNFHAVFHRDLCQQNFKCWYTTQSRLPVSVNQQMPITCPALLHLFLVWSTPSLMKRWRTPKLATHNFVLIWLILIKILADCVFLLMEQCGSYVFGYPAQKTLNGKKFWRMCTLILVGPNEIQQSWGFKAVLKAEILTVMLLKITCRKNT